MPMANGSLLGWTLARVFIQEELSIQQLYSTGLPSNLHHAVRLRNSGVL